MEKAKKRRKENEGNEEDDEGGNDSGSDGNGVFILSLPGKCSRSRRS